VLKVAQLLIFDQVQLPTFKAGTPSFPKGTLQQIKLGELLGSQFDDICAGATLPLQLQPFQVSGDLLLREAQVTAYASLALTTQIAACNLIAVMRLL
jgi:hypothetical protein